MASATKTKTQAQTQAKKLLQKILKKAQKAKLLPKSKVPFRWEIDLSLVSEAPMKKLNHFYRGKNKPTDVLSFPTPQVFQKQGVLGDLVICVPVMKRQAKERGHSVAVELEVLLVHGVLHLLGMDHEGSTPKARRQAKEMQKWERVLLGRAAGLIDI